MVVDGELSRRRRCRSQRRGGRLRRSDSLVPKHCAVDNVGGAPQRSLRIDKRGRAFIYDVGPAAGRVVDPRLRSAQPKATHARRCPLRHAYAAAALERRGENAAALRESREALAGYTLQGSERGIGGSHRLIASCQARLGNARAAREHVREARRLTERYGTRTGYLASCPRKPLYCKLLRSNATLPSMHAYCKTSHVRNVSTLVGLGCLRCRCCRPKLTSRS